MSKQTWQWGPAIYLAGLLVMNIISIPFGTFEMPEDCPEDTWNCDKRTIALDVSDEELHQAMEEWSDERSFTTTFSEGHIVDRTLFLQFPDDVIYENECGAVELFSKSRIGRSDYGVNADRMDEIVEYLSQYDFETTCQ